MKTKVWAESMGNEIVAILKEKGVDATVEKTDTPRVNVVITNPADNAFVKTFFPLRYWTE